MKSIITLTTYYLTLFFLSSCNYDASMVYQKKLLSETSKVKIYCYHLGWGIDGEAWYLSTNNEVCMGFDSTRDICFGKGVHHIYYEIQDDTLRLFASYIPTLPTTFPIKIKASELSLSEAREYAKKFKQGKVSLIDFDSITHKTMCDPIPFTSANNMKFKPRN